MVTLRRFWDKALNVITFSRISLSGTCLNSEISCPLHELNYRVNQIPQLKLNKSTDIEILWDIEWSITGPFGVYVNLSPLKFTILEILIHRKYRMKSKKFKSISMLDEKEDKIHWTRFNVVQSEEHFKLEILVRFN